MRETPEQIALIKELWADGHRRGYIADMAGITARRLDDLKHKLGLPKRQRGSQGGPTNERPPSPLEIRHRTALIRAGWDESDYADRTVGSRVLSITEMKTTPPPPGRAGRPTRPMPAEGRL